MKRPRQHIPLFNQYRCCFVLNQHTHAVAELADDRGADEHGLQRAGPCSINEVLLGLKPANRTVDLAAVGVAFDLDIARTHAHLIVDLAASGRLIGANDLLIASTALTRGYKLLTHNVRHFERVPGLTIEKADW